MAQVGTRIGSIRLTAVIGRGGMGEVFEGLDETLQRRVAVKSLRSDRGVFAESKARFLHEARILSRLHHPNICLVHDFIEQDGDAFLVMERIEGVTLARALETGIEHRERLDIAIQVADVLAAAHARGIVHRDLKPDNVMLTADGVAKVLDFGIARLEGGSEMPATPAPAASSVDGETTIVEPIDTIEPPTPSAAAPPRTTAGTIIGTPAFMSPEQALGDDVSPASDVYSFGLILQVLFTGKPAYEPGLDTLELLLRAGRGETRPVEGVDRELAALVRRMKSVEPEGRPTAPEVAHRLRRLRSRPARRRRWAVAAGLIVAAIAAGAKYTIDLRHEREQAVAAQREAETARDQAQTAQDQTEAVNDFLVSLLVSGSPGEALGAEVTVREVLDKAAATVPDRDDLDAPTKARYLLAVGTVYRDLALYPEARSALETAIDVAEGADGVEPRLVANLHLTLGQLEEFIDRVAETRVHYARALEILERGMPDDAQARAAVLNSLGSVELRLGELEAAQATYSKALDLMRSVKPPGDPQIGMVLGNIGVVAMERSDCAASIEATAEALAIFEAALGEGHPLVAMALNNLANCLETEGRFDEAYESRRRVVEIREQVLGPEHPDTAQALSNLGGFQARRGELEDAEQLLGRACSTLAAVYSDEHPLYLSCQLATVELEIERGDLEQALTIARDVSRRTRSLEGFHEVARTAESFLVDLLIDAGAPDEALDAALQGLEHRISRLGSDNELVGEGWILVAHARWASGEEAGARAALEASVRLGWPLDDVTEPEGLSELAQNVSTVASGSGT